jgi:hypothetical protein
MTEWTPGPGQPEQPNPYPPYPPAPPEGYTVTPQAYLPVEDPLVSPDFGGWWSRGLSIAKRGWKPLAALQAGGLLLVLLFQVPVEAYSAVLTERLSTSSARAQADLSPLFGLLGFTFAGAMLALIVTAVVTLATVHIGASIAVGAPVRVADALRLAGQRVLPMIGWQILALPIYLVAVCLCVLPVLYVAAVFLVLPVVVAVERTNAIGRCFSLFHGNLGTAVSRAATILGITIGAAIGGGLVGAALNAIGRSATPGETGIIVGSVFSTLVAAVVSGVVAILVAPLTLTAYADLRSRKEPASGAGIAAQLGIVPATGTPWSTGPTGYAGPPPA